MKYTYYLYKIYGYHINIIINLSKWILLFNSRQAEKYSHYIYCVSDVDKGRTKSLFINLLFTELREGLLPLNPDIISMIKKTYSHVMVGVDTIFQDLTRFI